MKKALVSIAAVIVIAAVGGGVYLATKSKNNSNNTNTTTSSTTKTTSTSSTTPKLQGNAEVQAVLNKVKANTSTVTATRVYTQSTDPNNELGKQSQYQYAGSFYDTSASPPDAVTDNYSTSDGGTIEIYSNNADATARGTYLAQFQSGAVQAGAYKVVGNVVLRVSENYTASQQTQMLALMQSAL
jgi:uncharacterized protein YxeA